MQKSQTGLIQNLLFQVLRQCPELIPKVTPKRCETSNDSSIQSWSYEELFEAADFVANQTSLPVKFCFFVDGLDEYTGNHTELILLLRKLALSLSIKLCVSSRPWNVFVDAFTPDHQLKLEDLTRNDIRAYVKGRLESSDEFTRLEAKDRGYTRIVDEILRRANGVFLWVRLVVDSLLRGLEEGDGILDMRTRLNSLPDDLEEYFRRILSTIDPVYRQQSAKIFQICILAKMALPVLAFWFLEEERKNPSYVLAAKTRAISEAEVDEIQERMKKHLRARCKDLLEINTWDSNVSFMKYRVDFVHKTVRDFFLTTPAVDSTLGPQTLTDVDVRLSLWRIILGLAKALPTDSPIADLRYEKTYLLSLAAAAMIETPGKEVERIDSPIARQQDSMELRLLKELERVLREQSERVLRIGLAVRILEYADAELRNKLIPVMRTHTGHALLNTVQSIILGEIKTKMRCMLEGALQHPNGASSEKRFNAGGLEQWRLDLLKAIVREPEATHGEGVSLSSSQGVLERRIRDHFHRLHALGADPGPQFSAYVHSVKDSLIELAKMLVLSKTLRSGFYSHEDLLLRVAIQTNRLPYVRKMLEVYSSEILRTSKSGQTYLDLVLRPSPGDVVVTLLETRGPNTEVLRFLLEEKQQDPNEPTVAGHTPWTRFLKDVYARVRHKGLRVRGLKYSRKAFYDAFRLLLHHGANPDAFFWQDWNGETRKRTVVDVLRATFPKDEADHLESTLGLTKNRKMVELENRKLRWLLLGTAGFLALRLLDQWLEMEIAEWLFVALETLVIQSIWLP